MLKAIIFDFDGVISNSEPTHFITFQRVLAEEGITISEADYFQQYLAMDDRGAFTTALTNFGQPVTATRLAELIERKSHYFHEQWQESIATYPDTIEFIKQWAGRLPLAINSGALRKEILAVLDRIEMLEYFSFIISAEDITNCKPHPEGYQKTLARLNQLELGFDARPANCLVIEDSVGGIRSACAAGMKCVAITNTFPASALTQAHLIVPSLNQLTETRLAEIFTTI